MKIEKVFSTTEEALKNLKRIFGVGNYFADGHGAEHRFCTAMVDGNKMILMSNFWRESDLEEIFQKGIDNVD